MRPAQKIGYSITGHLQINHHCAFPWSEIEHSALRTLEIRDQHCEPCIAELRRIAEENSYRLYDQRAPLGTRPQPEPCQAIVLIDDDEDVREAVSAYLSDAGYDVFGCANARLGLATIEHLHRPCLVLLDLNMPHMSGRDFLVQRSGDDRLAHMPVVLMTGEDPRDAAQQATAYLRKPIDVYNLRRLVERFCGPPPPETRH